MTGQRSKVKVTERSFITVCHSYLDVCVCVCVCVCVSVGVLLVVSVGVALGVFVGGVLLVAAARYFKRLTTTRLPLIYAVVLLARARV